MLNKLYENEYGSLPSDSPKMLNSKPPELNSKPADTLGQPQDTKPKKDEKGLVDSDCISDQYSDDFDDELGK